MPRYIDADAIDLGRVSDSICQWQAQEAIDDTPTADVVEVVRCKECKYREGSVCDYSAVYVRPDGYCQWGEKEDE